MRASRPPHARLTCVSCRSRALLQRSSGTAGQARHHPAGAPGRRGVLAHVKRQGADDEAIGVRAPGGADGRRGTRRPGPDTGHRPAGRTGARPLRRGHRLAQTVRPARPVAPAPATPPASPPPFPTAQERPGPRPGYGPHRVQSGGRSKNAERARNGIGRVRVRVREDRTLPGPGADRGRRCAAVRGVPVRRGGQSRLPVRAAAGPGPDRLPGACHRRPGRRSVSQLPDRHRLLDVRWPLGGLLPAATAGVRVHFTVGAHRHRMPPARSFVLARVLPVAENIAAYCGAWRHPCRLHGWEPVSASEWISWDLLISVTFVICRAPHPARPGDPAAGRPQNQTLKARSGGRA